MNGAGAAAPPASGALLGAPPFGVKEQRLWRQSVDDQRSALAAAGLSRFRFERVIRKSLTSVRDEVENEVVLIPRLFGMSNPSDMSPSNTAGQFLLKLDALISGEIKPAQLEAYALKSNPDEESPLSLGFKLLEPCSTDEEMAIACFNRAYTELTAPLRKITTELKTQIERLSSLSRLLTATESLSLKNLISCYWSSAFQLALLDFFIPTTFNALYELLDMLPILIKSAPDLRQFDNLEYLDPDAASSQEFNQKVEITDALLVLQVMMNRAFEGTILADRLNFFPGVPIHGASDAEIVANLRTQYGHFLPRLQQLQRAAAAADQARKPAEDKGNTTLQKLFGKRLQMEADNVHVFYYAARFYHSLASRAKQAGNFPQMIDCLSKAHQYYQEAMRTHADICHFASLLPASVKRTLDEDMDPLTFIGELKASDVLAMIQLSEAGALVYEEAGGALGQISYQKLLSRVDIVNAALGTTEEQVTQLMPLRYHPEIMLRYVTQVKIESSFAGVGSFQQARFWLESTAEKLESCYMSYARHKKIARPVATLLADRARASSEGTSPELKAIIVETVRLIREVRAAQSSCMTMLETANSQYRALTEPQAVPVSQPLPSAGVDSASEGSASKRVRTGPSPMTLPHTPYATVAAAPVSTALPALALPQAAAAQKETPALASGAPSSSFTFAPAPGRVCNGVGAGAANPKPGPLNFG